MRDAASILIAAALALSGCGTTTEERALSGGAFGAAGGAVIGALTGSWALGAVLGAATGVAAGALTTPEQIDVGKPIWKSSPNERSTSGGAAVRSIQADLARLGYDPGPTDGAAGARTRTAIRQYQQNNGLAVDGTPSSSLAEHIRTRL
jgi:osmotically inducible lipoprotein OsmB